MILALETLLTGKVFLLGTLFNTFICNVKGQKYWSCDENCPMRCSAGDDNLDKPICCYIPDVTILAITFVSQCHFDCANKCYSFGLKIRNDGPCTGEKSSESASEEEYDDEGDDDDWDDPDDKNDGEDEFDTAGEIDEDDPITMDSLEEQANLNIKDISSSAKHGRRTKAHNHNKTVGPTPAPADEWGSPDTDNEKGDDGVEVETADDGVEVENDEDEVDTDTEVETNETPSENGENTDKSKRSGKRINHEETKSDATNGTSGAKKLEDHISYDPVFENFQITEKEFKIPYMKDLYPSTTIVVPTEIDTNSGITINTSPTTITEVVTPISIATTTQTTTGTTTPISTTITTAPGTVLPETTEYLVTDTTLDNSTTKKAHKKKGRKATKGVVLPKGNKASRLAKLFGTNIRKLQALAEIDDEDE